MRVLVRSAAVGLLVLAAACAGPADHERYRPSGAETPLPAAGGAFAAYLRAVGAHLQRARVLHHPEDPAWELQANAPFERRPDPARCGAEGDRPARGILLVHGLADSPYTFRQLAGDLAERCFLVRTVLLPGHGTRPGDLLTVGHEDWIAAVESGFRQLSAEVEHAYLGGFSMGATLATLAALEQDDVDGLVLLSPAFADHDDMIWLAGYVQPFVTWLDADPEDNPVKYEAFSSNAAAAFAALTQRLEDRLDRRTVAVPVVMALSTDDRVIDGRLAVGTFTERMTAPASRLHVYTRAETRFPLPEDRRLRTFASTDETARIVNFSHMAPPFSPEDPYYGRDGSYRHCTSYEDPAAYRRCRDAPREELWLGSHGSQVISEERVYARLTYNPHYRELVDAIDATLRPEGPTTAVR